MSSVKGYARISNRLWRDPKTVSLAEHQPRAFSLWVLAITYCSDNLTDGLLDPMAIRMLGLSEKTLSCLVENGFLDEEPEGYRVHNYLAWQTSREEVEVRRSKDRERKRRQNSARNPNGIQNESEKTPFV